MFLNIFINELDEEKEGILIKCSDDIKLGDIADTSEERSEILGEFNRLEHWAKANKMGFNRGKCKFLNLDKENEIQSFWTDDDT